MTGPIYFYTKTMAFWGLSNFSPPGIEVDGIYWPTVEHYFQAQKFKDSTAQEQIRRAASPKTARELGQSRKYQLHPSWDNIREAVNARGVTTKVFTIFSSCTPTFNSRPITC